MNLSVAIRQCILNLLAEHNMSVNQLANESGLTASTLSSFLNGSSKNPQSSTILHICEGFNIQLKDFYDDDLFIDVIYEEDKKTKEPQV